MKPRIVEPGNEAEVELNAFLDARIYEFNVQTTGFCDGRPFSSVIKDESDNIIAAINGHTGAGVATSLAFGFMNRNVDTESVAHCSNLPRKRRLVAVVHSR